MEKKYVYNLPQVKCPRGFYLIMFSPYFKKNWDYVLAHLDFFFYALCQLEINCVLHSNNHQVAFSLFGYVVAVIVV